jgi:hypothetical protein
MYILYEYFGDSLYIEQLFMFWELTPLIETSCSDKVRRLSKRKHTSAFTRKNYELDKRCFVQQFGTKILTKLKL